MAETDFKAMAERSHAARRRQQRKSDATMLAESKFSPETPQGSMILARLSEMPKTCRPNYLRAMRGKSMASAVKAFCLECVCWDRQEVVLCTAKACPLYPYRPSKGIDDG